MGEIECVKNSDKYDQLFKKIFTTLGFNSKFFNWEDPRVSENSPVILVVDDKNIETAKEVCDDRDLKVLVGFENRVNFKLLTQLKPFQDKIFAYLDLSLDSDCHIPVITNYLNQICTTKNLSLSVHSKKIDEIHEKTQTELTQIKDLYDRFVKVRTDDGAGFLISSKFMSGEKSGGEIFDVIKDSDEVAIIQIGSDQYSMSSMIISELEILKYTYEGKGIRQLITEFKNKISILANLGNENHSKISYIFSIFNLKRMTATVEIKGKGCIYSYDTGIFYTESANIMLTHNFKLVNLSEGAIVNLKELNSELNLINFFQNHRELLTRDLINEFFFEVSKNKKGKFLNLDAVMNVIEIQKVKNING